MTGKRVGAMIIGIVLAVGARTLASQEPVWAFEVAVAATRYGGTSTETSAAAEPSAFRPHNPTVVTLTIGRRLGSVHLGLSASRGRSDIGVSGSGVLLVTDDLRATFYRLAPQVGLAVWRSVHEGQVWVSVGPAVERWTVTPSDEPRTRLGGAAALWFEQRLTGEIAGTVRLTGTLAPSPFAEGELPADYDRRATWSLALGLGLALLR